MKNQAIAVLMACLPAVSCSAPHASLRLEPSETIFISDNNRRLGISDIMVQTIALINDSAGPLTFEEIVLEAQAENQVILTDRISREVYGPVWDAFHAYLADPVVQKAEDSIILFSRVLPENVTVSPSLTMQPGTAILVRNRALVFSGYVEPETLNVRATAVDPGGRSVTVELTRRIARYEQKNQYTFPLRGRWYVSSSSSLRSHHRLRLGHEFALDLIKIGADGRSFRTDGATPADYYAFGEDVLAIAEGTVVAVEDEVGDTEMPRPGESRSEFAERVLDPMWEEDQTGRVAGGNFIVISHPGGEYSVYVHLKHRSVEVSAGDEVRAAQKIGEVGISGDGFQPHLHFGVMDDPSMSFSQGLPVTFTNVRPVGFSSTLDMDPKRLYLTGEFVETVP